MLNLELVQGSRADWVVQAVTRNRSAASGFLDSDALSASVWSGLDGAPVLTPSVSWSDSASAKVAVSIDDSQSAGLEQLGEYRLQVWATRGGDTGCIVDCSLKVLPAPGAGVQTVTPYCSLQDVLDAAPWVSQVQDLDSQQEGFQRQRIKAREWLDAVILANDRGGTVGQYGGMSEAAFAFGSGGGMRRSLGPSPSLLAYLAADKLIVRPKIKQIAAHKTASLIGLGLVGLNNKHAALGCFHRDLADSEIVCQVAEIDTNSDGLGEIFIPLSSSNTLFT